MKHTLDEIADKVALRAQRQGFVVEREVREELTRAGLPEDDWPRVIERAGERLQHKSGRYHHVAVVSARVRAEQSQRELVRQAVSEVIQGHRNDAARVERRGEERFDIVQPVRVSTEDGRQFTLLTRDLSTAGIRLIGTRRLLGQKLRVELPSATGMTWEFRVRILWTCPVGEDLVENGGDFVSVARQEEKN
jgi:hypothetical protein